MGPLIPVAMLVASLIKSGLDKNKGDKQRKLQAERIRLSPWTGSEPDRSEVPGADWFGNGLGFVSAGMGVGQSMEAADQASKINQIAIDRASANPGYMPSYVSPYGGGQSAAFMNNSTGDNPWVKAAPLTYQSQAFGKMGGW